MSVPSLNFDNFEFWELQLLDKRQVLTQQMKEIFLSCSEKYIYNKIVTHYFDSLAIRQSPYTKGTSSQHRYAPGFKG